MGERRNCFSGAHDIIDFIAHEDDPAVRQFLDHRLEFLGGVVEIQPFDLVRGNMIEMTGLSARSRIPGIISFSSGLNRSTWTALLGDRVDDFSERLFADASTKQGYAESPG